MDQHDLAAAVTGTVLEPGQDGFADALRGFQTGFTREPELVVEARTAGDVRAAVGHAARNGLPVAVECTGHGRQAGEAGGLLIRTARLDGIRIDAAAGTAYVEAGVRARELIDAAAPHGLAPVNGSEPGVGVIGYTLGGGLGILGRRFGYASDHVRAVDLVTADGRQRHVTADSDPDLWWALRGAGANFGVVTGIELALVPLTRLYGGGLYFDTDSVGAVLRAFPQWSRRMPAELTGSVAAFRYPDFPGIPEPLRGRYAAHVRIAYTGDADTGDRLIAPLRDIAPRLIDTVGSLPYTECGTIYADPPMPHSYYGSNLLVGDLDADTLHRVAELVGPDSAHHCVLDVRHLGGAMRIAPEPSAVGNREAAYIVRVLAGVDESDTGPIRSAVDRVAEALAPHVMGRAANFVYAASTGTDRLRDCYEPADRDRLVTLKHRYDPDNRFRFTATPLV